MSEPESTMVLPERAAPSVATILGNRLRSLRLRAGLSVRGVASRAGVSHGLLAQVERGEVNPSIATLAKVTSVFGISLTDSLLPEVESARVVRRHERRPFTYPSGSTSDRLVSSDTTGPFTVSRTRLEPGASSGGPSHLGGMEVIYVLDGWVVFEVADERWELYPGDAVTLESSEPHAWTNESGQVVELLWVLQTSPSAAPPC